MKIYNLFVFNGFDRLIFILLLSFPGLHQPALAQNIIPLSTHNLMVVHAQGEPHHLLDEQAVAGNPAAGQGGEPVTRYEAGYSDMYIPAEIIIDLEENYALSAMWYFDMHGKDSALFYAGTPGNWHLAGVMYTNKFRSWRSISFQDTTRFLKIKFLSNQANVAELVFYGQALGSGTDVSPQPVSMPQLTMGKFIGINGFVDDPQNILTRAAGTLREYHRWQWNDGDSDTAQPAYPNNELAFGPSYVSSFNFDQYYRDLHQNDVTVSPVIQASAPYLWQGRDPEVKPYMPGGDSYNPATYAAHADFMFQYAARYGAHSVPDSLLRLRSDQPRVSGLGYLQYVENWNEPEKWWRGTEAQFKPFEFAAMCSADYDGHEGSMGNNLGVKNADPNFKLVMGGLAGLNLHYLKAMKLWSDYNRSSGFPADVLNFHHYSNDATTKFQKPNTGVSPEADSLKYKLQELVAYRDTWLPGKEIWLSEFGYDTHPNSPQGAPAIGPYDEKEVQAQWLVRSFLEIAASGIDRAMMYMSRDVNAGNSRKYSSSGLTREKWNQHQPKKSFYYHSTFRNILKNYRFTQELPTGDARVNLYQFKHVKGDSVTYVLWCNTSEALLLPQFKAAIQGKSTAQYLQLRDQHLSPADSTVYIQNDSVTVPVSERPVFIKTVALDSVPPQAQARNVWVYLNEQGQATLSVNAVDSGSSDNQIIVEKSLMQKQFSCEDLPPGEDTTIITNKLLIADHYRTDTAYFQVFLADTVAPTPLTRVVNAYFNAPGVATISAADAEDGSFDNCATITHKELSDSVFYCGDAHFSAPVTVVSDASWQRSTWVNQDDASGWPWQPTDTLPALATFTESVTLGQPYHYHSVDSVPGARPIMADNFLRYYRTTFHLSQLPLAKAQFFLTVDDNMSIFINGTRIAYENGNTRSSGSKALHQFIIHADGSAHDSVNSTTPVRNFEEVKLNKVLQAGENELILGVHNYNNLGGFSFKMELYKNAVYSNLQVKDAHGKWNSSPVTVVLRDTGQVCTTSQYKKASDNAMVNGLEKEDFTLYPVPTQGRFYMDMPGLPPANGKLHLFSESGALIETFNLQPVDKQQWNINHLPKGLYTLRVTGYAKPYYFKLVKI